MRPSLENLIEVGYGYLIKQFSLSVIPHYRTSYITKVGRGSTSVKQNQEIIIYPKSYALHDPKNSLKQLEFAIKHDGINLEIITCFFEHVSQKKITDFVRKTPTGKYNRIIWFLYEYLTNNLLILGDTKNVPYVNILDPKKYYTAIPIKSSRHAVKNNLLGDNKFCPCVRKTAILIQLLDRCGGF